MKKELALLFEINQVMVESYGKVSVSNMLSLYKSLDADVLINLYAVYDKIKEKENDKLETRKNFKKVVLEIMGTNEIVNEEVSYNLNDAFKKSLEVKESLYLTMIDKKQANRLFDNCMRRSKIFLRECESRNLEKVIYCLKNNFKLSDSELVDISKRCASFFIATNVNKINNLHKSIEEFKSYINKQSSKMSSALEIKRLLEKNFKGVLKESSSVATLNSNSINKTLKFLMGEKLGDLSPVNKNLFNIRANFTPFQLAKLYNESITSLGISVEKIANVCDSIKEVYRKTYNSEVDLNNLINGNNFSSISQLTKEDYMKGGKIEEIFSLLAMFISSEDMTNLLKNDFSFLIASPSSVKQSLQEAVLSSSNKDELKYNVLKKIRGHFDIYERIPSNFPRENKDNKSLSKLNKISIRDIDEEEIKDVLKKLEVENDKIEVWEKKWDKDDREYRDLAIEIELEDLNNKIDETKDFLKIQFVNVEQFISDVLAVKELFVEMDNEYSDIVNGKKLNKNLKSLAEYTYFNLEEVRASINDKIDFVKATYEKEIEEANKALNDIVSMLGKNREKENKRLELDRLIEEREITVEKFNMLRASIKDLESLISEVDVSIDTIEGNEKKANDLTSRYFVLLREEAKADILKSGIYSNGEIKRPFSKFFPMFIYSLEVDGLIDNADLVLGRPYNLPKESYKKYRNKLNREERLITDEVHRLYVENMNLKATMRDKITSYLEKYGLDIIDTELSQDRILRVIELYKQLERQLDEDVEIVKTRSKYDEEKLKKDFESLLEEQEKLNKLLETYCNKINLLTKEKITR